LEMPAVGSAVEVAVAVVVPEMACVGARDWQRLNARTAPTDEWMTYSRSSATTRWPRGCWSRRSPWRLLSFVPGDRTARCPTPGRRRQLAQDADEASHFVSRPTGPSELPIPMTCPQDSSAQSARPQSLLSCSDFLVPHDTATSLSPPDQGGAPSSQRVGSISRHFVADSELQPSACDKGSCAPRCFLRQQNYRNCRYFFENKALFRTRTGDPLLTMEVPRRHARTRAITRDTVSPANRAVGEGGDASRDVARVVSDVSVLCPREVDGADNSQANRDRYPLARVSVTPTERPCALGGLHKE
jgi:hypothetical protein